MKEFVSKVKQLHDFDIILDGKIEEIIADPKKWAEDFAEKAALLEINRFKKARKLGVEFGEALD